MFDRRIPEWLRHAPAPSVQGFAVLAGFEAIIRGILISVFPIAMYDALQDAALVSSAYFFIGCVSLLVGLCLPFLSRYIPRRVLFCMGAMGYVTSAMIAILAPPGLIVLALALSSFSTVTTFVCFNAYVLDYITRIELGRCETLRLFYSALGWTVGPVLGISLWGWWGPLPFLISGLTAMAMMGVFLYMRLGNGKLIVRAQPAARNPVAYISRFMGQPRLIAGWLFAVIRSCGWWAYIVYLPIFAVENGMSTQLGGALLSVTNAALFAAPLMLRFVQANSIRTSVRTGFLACALLFGAATIGAQAPWLTVAFLFTGSIWLIFLDICGGLPFLMAVKPSERTEMSAIYSSYRDVSGIATPGMAWAILMFTPIAGIFAAVGAASLVAWVISGRLHPRLGTRRLDVATPLTLPDPPVDAVTVPST